MKKQRYFLDRDSSGHWYLVNAAFRSEWDAWLEIDEDDEASWAQPDYATELRGGPSYVEFSDPEEL